MLLLNTYTTNKIFVKPFQSVLKSEALTICVVIGEDKSLCRKKKILRDLSCDASCIDGGQLKISSQNISPNKSDIKII